MKPRNLLFASLVGTGLMASAAVIAQDQTMQPSSSPQTSMQQPTTAPQTSAAQEPSAATQNSTMQAPSQQPGNSATYGSAQGPVTVNSAMGRTPSTASPPTFEQLSGGSGVITKEQANAYPPLANDFIHVAGHSDHITKAQYESWLQKLN